MKINKLAALGLVALIVVPASSWAVSVTRYHNDAGGSGVNSQETILTTSNVNTTTFGKLYSLPVDGQIYAQPLYVPDLTIGGVLHNVLYVATMNNTMYAFDADSPTAGSTPLWHVHYGNPVSSSQDIIPQVGILSTPVIDLSRNALYFVTDTYASSQATFSLHAVDLATGKDRVGSPAVISGSVPGTGDGSTGGVLPFAPISSLQRPGLQEVNGNIFVAFGSRADKSPYHGWIFGYDGLSLRRTVIKCITPNGFGGGVWQGGGGLTADSSGNLYVATGNGVYNPATQDYSDTIMKMSTAQGLAMSTSFTPANYAYLESYDLDTASGNVMPVPGSSPPLVIAGGKDGNIYLLNANGMGGYSPSNAGALQTFWVGAERLGGNVLYNNTYYFWGTGSTLKMWRFTGNSFVAAGGGTYTIPNGDPNIPAMSLSANGTTAGTAILWAAHSQMVGADGTNHPGMLHAINATTGAELWNSNMIAGDFPGAWSKFTPPTIANGKVYLATFDSGVAVYGLIGAINLTSSPGSLTFNDYLGGNAPASQTLNIATTTRSGINYTAAVTAGSSWLQLSSSAGSTPSPTQVSVNTTGLTAGTYTGAITVTAAGAANSPITIPVTLNVQPNVLSVTPSPMTITYGLGGFSPPAQYLNVTSAGAGLNYTATITAGSSWLQLSNPSGVTPSTTTGVTINPAGLGVGTYNGSISISAANTSNSPVTVPVTLNVTAAPPVIAGPIQQATGAAVTSSVTATINPPALGDALIATIATSTVNPVVSVTGGGVTWYKAQGSATVRDTEIWYGLNSSGSGNSVVVTFQGAYASALNVTEWYGFPSGAPVTDGSGASNYTVGVPATGSVTLSNPGSLIIACTSTNSQPTAVNNGFTALTSIIGGNVSNKNTFFLNTAYYMPGATGTYSASWTAGLQGRTEGEIVAILP